jgi:hypothetical protein
LAEEWEEQFAYYSPVMFCFRRGFDRRWRRSRGAFWRLEFSMETLGLFKRNLFPVINFLIQPAQLSLVGRIIFAPQVLQIRG